MRADIAQLVLPNHIKFKGKSFGYPKSIAGEVVFNTGMTGYVESLTDPSYRGQILVFSYPLIGNYGVPESKVVKGIPKYFESSRIQVAGVIVSDYSHDYRHWQAVRSLGAWLQQEKIPALSGIDTRHLTTILREEGSVLGKIQFPGDKIHFDDPNKRNLVSEVSITQPRVYKGGKQKIVVVDCGVKFNIIRSLLGRGFTVKHVPWDYDYSQDAFAGIVFSNGPGDPAMCPDTVNLLSQQYKKSKPILGICLGSQIMARAAGAKTYKLKFGHRSHNQPCLVKNTKRCYITSQNHGYAVRSSTLPRHWQVWMTNANDGTIEAIKHKSKPFWGVQFHPEATPGPVDTNFIFDEWVKLVKRQ
ncbi:MAG: carbamoyl-phosphate synthase (glutamine-hydrolyzing) small subunit [Candidatus Buchananbacteria bacterium CG10_big_fil_rev_8_21_14_0_10_42_9]|uniref:Carbamoyl phosphate synthase small chain n=1 Tax=Candidatus Buchananbacteria bacterium CG10_big_fil_rev_8_21_14_0_10_42_9 TaxID=1974526 RepID=A0A2H0W1R2_9BACT|nr:MAG: carbamoyl-phosphate synthase (glutamine-hydrolyzing) small subunit [Candidatus Buchananbacteria bacterium CG10_big_fil_rev_8_21_14_0_10_42_9]